jgi:hypothetical protein
LAPGVLQAVDDLVGLPPPVEAHQDGPEVDGGPEGEAPLGVVLAQHRHPVAVADAEAVPEGGAHAVGLAHEGGEAVAAVAVDQEVLVVAAQHGHLGDLPQGPHPLLVDLHRAAEDLLGHDLEHPTRSRELGPHLGGGRHVASPWVADVAVSGD